MIGGRGPEHDIGAAIAVEQLLQASLVLCREVGHRPVGNVHGQVERAQIKQFGGGAASAGNRECRL